MKLAVNLIVAGGRYFKAGEEVPADQVPPKFAKHAARTDTDAKAQAPKPQEAPQAQDSIASSDEPRHKHFPSARSRRRE